MYVRLAGDWTGPDRARHCAGDLVEVDNVTLAEMEEGGIVEADDAPQQTGEQTGESPDASTTPEGRAPER